MAGLFHVSAREHAALILLTEIAGRFSKSSYVSLQEVAERMHLSQGYLEEIASALKRAALIEGKTGPQGGYRLVRPPEQISLEDILDAIEGPLALVDCQSASLACPVEGQCSSKRIWGALQFTIRQALRTTTLAHVL